MTTPLYQDDPYLARCAARSTAVQETPGGLAVLLDQSVFYPQGGGQPGDRGVLRWDGGEAEVANTVKGEAHGQAWHVLAEGSTPPPDGAALEAEIDWDHRLGCMRMHTALHLLSVVIPQPVTGGQIGPDKGRLDFDMPDAPGDKVALEATLSRLIEEDHPVETEWITDEELAANPGLVKTMAVKPPVGQGRVRLVRIGSGESPVDLQPCGGTHVKRTGEIGHIAFGKIEKKGKRNRRVSLVFAAP